MKPLRSPASLVSLRSPRRPRHLGRIAALAGLLASLALASTTISNLTVEGGQSQIFSDSGQILTAVNPSATTVEAQSNGTLIFWSGGGVHLEPGFHAANGAFFWAAVDSDMNGYSDQEEITDTDGDGMSDAWEADHGLNPIVNDALADLDGDGMNNLQEYLTGRDPNDNADGQTLPGDVRVVLRTPSSQYYGVATTTWALSGVASP